MQCGTCFLIGALQCQAALLPQVKAEDTIMAWHRELGIWCVRFMHLGQWKVVTVDDQLPVRSSTQQPGHVYPVLAECKDGCSAWLPILEKAYAKLHG